MVSPAVGRLVLAVVVIAVGAGGCTDDPPSSSRRATVDVSPGHCGDGWDAPHGGEQTVTVGNVGTVTMDVELVDPASHGVYAEIESLAAGITRPLHLVLGRGAYAFTC